MAKKIKESDFVSFTICGDGWSFTVYSWEKAKIEFNMMRFGTLYGNKADGTQVKIDTR